ncbi:hypothetical protein C0Z18_11385 [Trinickia dabaoshanensis]|uniref:DUF4410 domain-containing protein n=1 Tax=Trinickia dabaoshanensis TaxID=564714 RepID=A0A2N7VS89_9BURK|nr:hypothetical protein [Trinickia dabaoshanensis]PMS20015.1 hypothetical protein C0Z18_11385 [Trinickia dabaoshanensis]
MRNLGRTVTAFTIWAAIAAISPASAQTQLDRAGGDSIAGDPAAGDPIVGGPISSPPDEDQRMTVAPQAVAQVTVAPTAPVPAPSAPVTPVRQGPPPMAGVPDAVYVTNFVAVPVNASAAGLLARLRAALHAHAAGHDAGLVAQAVVQRLNHAGIAARYLAPGDQPPVVGWLIGGVFHLQGETQPAADDGTASGSGSEALGADVSVTVADLEHGADTPFAIIGVPPAAAASGSERPWTPYVVPAKLSFERTDRNAAIAALARQIADAFVGNMTALRQADANAMTP